MSQKGMICPYCCNQIGLCVTDLWTTFMPWKAPFVRECEECGRTFGCTTRIRAGAWYRYCILPIWPVAAYVIERLLYADNPDRPAVWLMSFLMGFLPASLISWIPGHIGKVIESGRAEGSPVPRGAYVLYVAWPVIVALLAIICKIIFG